MELGGGVAAALAAISAPRYSAQRAIASLWTDGEMQPGASAAHSAAGSYIAVQSSGFGIRNHIEIWL